MHSHIDLHLHLLQSLRLTDLIELATPYYRDIDWNRFGFLDRYEKIFGFRPSIIEAFDRVVQTGHNDLLARWMIYRYHSNGSFQEFDVLSFFPICITGYYFDHNMEHLVFDKIIERAKKEHLTYVQYRHGFVFTTYEEWSYWNLLLMRYFKRVSTQDFQVRYIIRIHPLFIDYLFQLLDENKDLADVVVGIDFTGAEKSPVDLVDFYDKIRQYNLHHLNQLDVMIHSGEVFDDRSIESAIRWIHDSVKLGATRIGHAVVLGLDPHIMVHRYADAYTKETVKERLAQLDYDLKHEDLLKKYGVHIDRALILREKNELQRLDHQQLIHRDYDKHRIEDIKNRQRMVIDYLEDKKTPIEVCPTSNLCIAGLPSPSHHPLFRFMKTQLQLVICTDDPGVFDISLNDEIVYVKQLLHLDESTFINHFVDPICFIK